MSVVDGRGRWQVQVAGGTGRGQVPMVGGARREQVPVDGGAEREQVSVVGGAGREQVPVVGGAGRGSSDGSVPAVVNKERDGVAYVINGEIFSVGIVDVNRSVLHGHKIEAGFVCVLITYTKNECVPAPVIMGNPEENSYLKKGMYFSLPISNLFKCEKYIAGDKVVLR